MSKDSGTPPELYECPFCGLEVDAPCEVCPSDVCEKAIAMDDLRLTENDYQKELQAIAGAKPSPEPVSELPPEPDNIDWLRTKRSKPEFFKILEGDRITLEYIDALRLAAIKLQARVRELEQCKKVTDDILEIMRVYHEQEARPQGVETHPEDSNTWATCGASL